jgi:hypothetical protein
MPRRRRTHEEIWEERQGAAAAELIALLETATSDGVLTDEEIQAIREWLDRRGLRHVPNADQLRVILDHVLADGKITETERREVYRAVERVLPAELRQRARSVRLAREAVEKMRRQEEKRRNTPVLRLDIPVVGIPYDRRAEIVKRFARVDDPVYLVREPDNPVDPNAIMVLLRQGYQIGYVPREEAEGLAPLLDAGCKQRARIKKILRGRSYPLPYMVAEIYQPDADVPGLTSPDELPEKRPAPIPQSSAIRDWPCSCLLAGGGLAALLLLFVLSGGLRGC